MDPQPDAALGVNEEEDPEAEILSMSREKAQLSKGKDRVTDDDHHMCILCHCPPFEFGRVKGEEYRDSRQNRRYEDLRVRVRSDSVSLDSGDRSR